jgi:hypothetical protein
MDELRLRAQNPMLRFGEGIVAEALRGLSRPIALLTQPAPAASIDPTARSRAAVERMVTSLAEDDLRVLELNLPIVELIVGVGGGLVMDAAKYVRLATRQANRAGPSVVSVVASAALGDASNLAGAALLAARIGAVDVPTAGLTRVLHRRTPTAGTDRPPDLSPGTESIAGPATFCLVGKGSRAKSRRLKWGGTYPCSVSNRRRPSGTVEAIA